MIFVKVVFLVVGLSVIVVCVSILLIFNDDWIVFGECVGDVEIGMLFD